MADVSVSDTVGQESTDRGQIILVTGLAIAVMLVALVLLLNTVIYTQNLATRGVEVDDGEAISFRQEARAGVGRVIDAENREEYDTQAKVEENVTEAVGRFDALLSRYYAESVTVADVQAETLSLTDGYLLRQTNASRNFTNAGGISGDWTLVSDAGAGDGPGVRNATFTVAGENLSDSTSSAFSFRLYGSAGNDWRVYLYNDTANDEITVAVKNGTESTPHDVCSASGPEATVDLTAGTINGSACPQLAWAAGVSAPYDVAFRNARDVTGTYAMTVATPDGATTNVETGNFAGADAEESPRAVPAVYAAEFEIHFETPSVAFHTTVRVAPGEPT